MSPHIPVSPGIRRLRAALVFGVVGLTVIAARPLASHSVTPPRADGLTFTYSMTSASGAHDKKRKEMLDKVATVQVQDGNMRLDYSVGSPMPGQKGGYMLVLGETKQFAIVSDQDKTVVIMDAAMFGSGAGAMMNNPMMKMSIKDQKFSFQDMGAGDRILGYATRHVRVISGSTTEIRVLGMKRSSTSADTSEQWIAGDLGIDEETLAAWARAFGSGFHSTNPDLAEQMEKYHHEYGRKGMALRTVSRTAVSDDKGKVEHDTMTIEVTDLKKGRINAAVFKIPADYQVTNLGDMMASAKSSIDSAKAESNKKDAKDEKKDDKKDDKKKDSTSAKDGLKAGLKGLFKKPPQR